MCVMALGALGAAGGAAGGAMSIGSILQPILGIFGAISSYQGQMAAYKEQQRFRMEQAVQAQKTLNQQVAQQQTNRESELNKAQQASFKTTREKLKASSLASAAAAESGAFGLSTANLLGDIELQGAEHQAALLYNADVHYKEATNSLKMAQRGAQARVASIPIPTKPSFMPTAVEIGTSLVGAFGSSGYRGTPGVHGV